MINRKQLDKFISKTIDKCDNEFNLSDVTIDEVISILSTNEEYKEKIKDIYTSIIHAEYDYEDDYENGRSYDYIYDFKYQAEIAVTKYERDGLLKDGVESLLKDYKYDIAHLVTGIREITDALIQANIIIRQQAEEIKETKKELNSAEEELKYGYQADEEDK